MARADTSRKRRRDDWVSNAVGDGEGGRRRMPKSQSRKKKSPKLQNPQRAFRDPTNLNMSIIYFVRSSVSQDANRISKRCARTVPKHLHRSVTRHPTATKSRHRLIERICKTFDDTRGAVPSKSRGVHSPCRFDSDLRHQIPNNFTDRTVARGPWREPDRRKYNTSLTLRKSRAATVRR